MSEDITPLDTTIYIDKVPVNSAYKNPPTPNVNNGELLHLTISSVPDNATSAPQKVEIVSVRDMVTDPTDSSRWRLTVLRGPDIKNKHVPAPRGSNPEDRSVDSTDAYSFDAGSYIYLANTTAVIDSKMTIEVHRTDEDGELDPQGDFETTFSINSSGYKTIIHSHRKY